MRTPIDGRRRGLYGECQNFRGGHREEHKCKTECEGSEGKFQCWPFRIGSSQFNLSRLIPAEAVALFLLQLLQSR